MASPQDNSLAPAELAGPTKPESSSAPGALSDAPSKNPDKTMDEESNAEALQPGDSTAVPAKASPGTESTSRPSENGAKSATKAATPKGASSKTAAAPAKRPVTKPVGPTRATGSATRPTQSSAAAAKKTAPAAAPAQAGANDAGFVKPKPKSPTKPVNLPSSLMAPTASSVSKGGASRLSTSRQSGNLPQSASAHSIGATAASNTVKRQSSQANRARPSLGVPPNRTAQQEANKRQSHVDDGFLARMMRPTQASSSKLADKSEAAPPTKESAARSSLSGTRQGPHSDSKKTAKSPVNKKSDSTTQSRATPTPSNKPAAKATTSSKPQTATAGDGKAPDHSGPAKHHAPDPRAPELVAPNPIVDESTTTQPSPGANLTEKLGDLKVDEQASTKANEDSAVSDTAPEQQDSADKNDLADTEPIKEDSVAEPIEDEEEPRTADTEAAEEDGAAEKEPETEPAVEHETVLEPEFDEIVEPEAHDPEPEPAALEEAAVESAQVETADEAVEIADEVDPVHETVDSEALAGGEDAASKTNETAIESEPLVSIDANHAGRKSAAPGEEAEPDADASGKTASSTVQADKGEATEGGN